MDHSVKRETLVWEGIVFELINPAEQHQTEALLPVVLEAQESCRAGDVAKTVALLDRCLELGDPPMVDLYPVFLLACQTGPADLVSALLDRGFKPILSPAEGAIAGRQVKILELLKAAGWDHLGRSTEEPVPGPLYLAVATPDADRDVVQWFLDNGAEPDRRCLLDKTVLSYAVGHAPLDIIKLLIEHVPGHHPQHGELLHAVACRPAVMQDHADVLELLLKCTSFKADALIHREDVFSRAMIAFTGAGMPLHFAALYDNPKAAEALISVGASLMVLDDNGDYHIDIARRYNHQAVLDVLARAKTVQSRGE